MKVENSRRILFTLLFLTSMASFLYLQLGYDTNQKFADAEKKIINSEKFLEKSEKNFHDFSLAKIIINNIVNVVIIKQ